MNSRQKLLLAAVLLLAGTGVTLTARTNDSSTAGEKPDKVAEQPSDASSSASGGREDATTTAPAREEAKPQKPAKPRPVWPPPSELIA